MTSRAIVPPKLVSETRTDPLDFAPQLAVGQSLVSVAAVVSVYSGTDASPSALVTALSVSGTNALVTYGAGVLGVIYAIRLEALTSGPVGTVTLAYFLAIIPELP